MFSEASFMFFRGGEEFTHIPPNRVPPFRQRDPLIVTPSAGHCNASYRNAVLFISVSDHLPLRVLAAGRPGPLPPVVGRHRPRLPVPLRPSDRPIRARYMQRSDRTEDQVRKKEEHVHYCYLFLLTYSEAM